MSEEIKEEQVSEPAAPQPSPEPIAEPDYEDLNDWDDIPESSAPISSEPATDSDGDGQSEEESDSNKDGEEKPESEEKQEDSEVEEKEADKEGSEEPKEEEEEGEESGEVEIPEELVAEGITKNEEGELGLKYKADGEEKFISLKDIKAHEAGKVAWDRKFTELDQERKSFESDLQQVNTYINDFGQKMREGDVVGAFEYFGEFANIPSYVIKENLIAALQPEIDRRQGLTQAELQNELLQEQNKYLQNQNESESKRRQTEQSNLELQKTVATLRETQGISEGEWDSAVSYLSEHPNIDNNAITPEFVADYVTNYRGYQKAESIIEGLDVPATESDAFIDELQQIIVRNPEFSDDDLISLVKRAIQPKEQEALGKQIIDRKQKSAPNKKVKTKKQEAQPVIEDSGADDWDDII